MDYTEEYSIIQIYVGVHLNGHVYPLLNRGNLKLRRDRDSFQ